MERSIEGNVDLERKQNRIARTFTTFAEQRMAKSLENIARCVSQLSEEQMHFRTGEHENSVVNLLVHLQGNVRQWILSGVAEQLDARDRDAEFVLDLHMSGVDAMAALSSTVADARLVIQGVSADRLMEPLSGEDFIGVEAIEGVAPVHLREAPADEILGAAQHETLLVGIAHVFSHFEYHSGQIVLLTKQLTGRDLDLTTPRKR